MIDGTVVSEAVKGAVGVLLITLGPVVLLALLAAWAWGVFPW